ncbi:MAG TPA: DUF1015 domain-containing protein [Candidatus Bathyarchaeia archaeon]|nr:DUF1015 domain-containing protein [Candidatus Bathyarchaeia archaeon]
MVDIRPFKGIRYTERAGDPKNLITQPYDKIDTAMQKEYYEKSPYNYCRLILPMEKNKYEVARNRIQDWLREGVLAKDEEPAVFVCRQEFKLDGESCIRTGVIAALRLYSYHENVVFPHEITYSAPKADRLNMLRTVQKDLEPVFLIYSDPENVTVNLFAEASKAKPIIEVIDAFNVKHTVWKVTDLEKIRMLKKALEPKILVITDGHHRYESAIAYRDERRRQEDWTVGSAFNFHMSLLVPVQDEGLVVLPTHRLLKHHTLTKEALDSLKRFFDVLEIGTSVKGVDAFLAGHRNEHAFAIYGGSKAYGLLLKHEQSVYEFVSARASKETKLFDVIILHDVIFKAILKTGELRMDEDILYERWTKSAVEKVDSGEAKLAFLVNPLSAEAVWRIAQEHERMPEKTTDFYPKPASGLMMMDVASGEKLS